MSKKRDAFVEERLKFESFLSEMSDVLDVFRADRELVLDFSLASLAALESLLLQESQGVEGERLDLLKNRAARYLGEVFLRVVGGEWDLCLEKRHFYFGLPVIAGYSGMGLKFCPIECVAIFLKRRNAGFFSGVMINNHLPYSFVGGGKLLIKTKAAKQASRSTRKR